MWLYHSDQFAEHRTGAHHPECPARIERVNQHLKQLGLTDAAQPASWQPASLEALRRIHGDAYLQQVEEACKGGGGYIEADTVVSARSWEIARLAAGAAIDAVDRVLTSTDTRAFCAIRPPGHHALVAAPMGFCLLNNVAIAARHAVKAHQLDRVLIVDFDVHHGNGTQDVFYSDGQVAFLSMHRWPFYPGTGAAEETGTGRGLGLIKNIPLARSTPARDTCAAFEKGLNDLLQKFAPQLCLISAGFDAYHADPVGGLGLEPEHFATLTQSIISATNGSTQGKVVSLLEGGYHLEMLPLCLQSHLSSLR